MSIENENDDDGQEDNMSMHQYYNTHFSNHIVSVVHHLPYSKIDFDLLRVDHYDKLIL